MDAQKRIKQLMEERGWTDYRLAKEADLGSGVRGVWYNISAVFLGR